MTSEIIEFTDPGDRGRTWQFERAFLDSNWTCIWGRGCVGILDQPAEHLNQGCCSVGAEVPDDEEAMMIAALGATLDPARFQFHDLASEGVFGTESRSGFRNTRVVDGACIFLNRPGFDGGSGCALHIGAVESGEEPQEWKPSVCWQLPVRVDYEQRNDGTEAAMVRRWSRDDWGDEGPSMAWLCTDSSEESRAVADAFVGGERVLDSLATELCALLGREVYVELFERMSE